MILKYCGHEHYNYEKYQDEEFIDNIKKENNFFAIDFDLNASTFITY